MWHIANTSGPYAAPFGTMRSYGPLPTARFDPHPPPPRDHPGERILYAAGNLVTALAERFQRAREIRRFQPGAPIAYSWSATRTLRLLDLSGRGALRLGASHAINTGPKNVTRTWARALRASFPDADGVMYSSSMTGEPCVALWAPAAETFPAAPAFACLLAHPATTWTTRLRFAAAQLHYQYH